MAVFVEDIKRLMGWCPNMGAMKARKAMQFDDIMVKSHSGFHPDWECRQSLRPPYVHLRFGFQSKENEPFPQAD